MRISRRCLLSSPSGVVHKYWRCHNRSYHMDADSIKAMYLDCTKTGLKHKSSNSQIELHAYCVMDNHSHQVVKYSNGMDNLSNFMRIAHGEFGRRFNHATKRTGKVANERPKTVVVQDSDHSQMRAQFYVEANPIRANKRKFENLKLYKFSSFRFYAFGIIDEFTKNLVPPDWYLRLGKTPEERQQKYRSLFQKYLKWTKNEPFDYLGRFIGEIYWCLEQLEMLRKRTKNARAGPA